MLVSGDQYIVAGALRTITCRDDRVQHGSVCCEEWGSKESSEFYVLMTTRWCKGSSESTVMGEELLEGGRGPRPQPYPFQVWTVTDPARMAKLLNEVPMMLVVMRAL